MRCKSVVRRAGEGFSLHGWVETETVSAPVKTDVVRSEVRNTLLTALLAHPAAQVAVCERGKFLATTCEPGDRGH